jgi:hypothetical protein
MEDCTWSSNIGDAKLSATSSEKDPICIRLPSHPSARYLCILS